jgi:CDP-paratose synthetase
MRILITGGSGFLGRHVVNYFLDNSNHYLILLTRDESDYSWLDKIGQHRFENVTLEEIRSIKSGDFEHYADTILHMATEYGRNTEDVDQILISNLGLPISLLQFAKTARIPHYVNIDSYFNKPGNAYDYLGDYAKSKKALALWYPAYSETLAITNIILEHVYGPGDSPLKFVPTFMRSASKNFDDGTTFSQGEQIRDFVYVTDVASALLQVVSQKDLDKGVRNMNLGTGVGTSLTEFGRIVCEQLGVTSKPPFGSGSYRENEIMASVADLSLFTKINWSPKFTLEMGIQETILKEKLL